MKAIVKTGALAGITLTFLVSCNSSDFNRRITSGTPDTLYTSAKFPAPLPETIAPVATDSTGKQTGSMSDTKMTH